MSVKSSFYNEYDIKNNEKHVSWAQCSLQNHHQTFHDQCPEKIGPLPEKSDHCFNRTCPENMGLASTCWLGHQLQGEAGQAGSIQWLTRCVPTISTILLQDSDCKAIFVYFSWNHQQCCWFLYVETCNFGETNPQYRAPKKCMPSETCFDDVGRNCACVT